MGIEFDNEALFNATRAHRVEFKIDRDFTYRLEEVRERTEIFRALNPLRFVDSFAVSLASDIANKAKFEFQGLKIKTLDKALVDYGFGIEADVVLAGFARSKEGCLYTPIVGVASCSNIGSNDIDLFNRYVSKKIADEDYLMEALNKLK
ncbi:hypothetical protein HYX17_05095 [Candidatus Woesearchaeota archaeon]|nr:hypothetical protein [Candidatus Woesearchaeota archaeon]